MTDIIAICCISSNGKIKGFPNKKLAKMVPAKQVRILDTQEETGCEYAKDTEPETIRSRVKSHGLINFYSKMNYSSSTNIYP